MKGLVDILGCEESSLRLQKLRLQKDVRELQLETKRLEQENERLSRLLSKCNKHIDAQKLREERLALKRENERLRESVGAWREYVEEAMNDVENIHYECKALLDKLESWLYPDGGTEDDTETT